MERTLTAGYAARESFRDQYSKWLSKIDIPAYGKGEDLFNAISHLAGVLFGMFAFGLFLKTALVSDASLHTIVGVSIYSLSLVALYAVSGIYHVLRPGNAKRVMRVMDHCTIYLLIAGCYTPVALIAFWGYSWAPIMLAAEWGIAIIGIAVNMYDMTAMRVKVFSIISYLVMGWMIVFVPLDTLLSVGASWMPWVFGGGVAYTAGMIFYGIGSKVRYMHGVWHIFVLAGSILQFVGFVQMI